MTLHELASFLDAKNISTSDDLNNIVVNNAYACDLMSDVLAFCTPGSLLLTGLTNVQIVRTAQMLDIPAIIFVRGKGPAGRDGPACKRQRDPYPPYKIQHV